MSKGRTISVAVCCTAVVLLILDSKCAVRSAVGSVDLCLHTLVPSLFPMFVLTGWLVPQLRQLRLPWLSRLLGIPSGSEGLFLVGAVGGFPIGASCIGQAVEAGALSESDGKRMLGFCNNCGPAFLFGVLGSVLDDPQMVAAVFVIQLETALLLGMLLPGRSSGTVRDTSERISLPQAVDRGVRSMVSVCAWVILANVLADFLARWLFPLLPQGVGLVASGLLELTNGCVALRDLSGEAAFLLSCLFVCFGGLCVHLQIHAFVPWWCAGQKAVQALLGVALGALFLQFQWAGLLAPVAVAVVKKTVEISTPLVYNSPNQG